MAKELAVGGGKMNGGAISVPKKAAKKAAKKSAHRLKVNSEKSLRKAVGKAPEKAAKKSAKKSAKKAAKKAAPLHGGKKHDLERAFHHLERAGSVVALLEDHSGGDLRALLQEATKAYGAARKSGERRDVDVATGMARACEHLALGGMYEAWERGPSDLGDIGRVDVERMLARVEHAREEARGRAAEWLGIATSILEQAEEEHDRPHLVWELVKAAEGLLEAAEAR